MALADGSLNASFADRLLMKLCSKLILTFQSYVVPEGQSAEFNRVTEVTETRQQRHEKEVVVALLPPAALEDLLHFDQLNL